MIILNLSSSKKLFFSSLLQKNFFFSSLLQKNFFFPSHIGSLFFLTISPSRFYIYLVNPSFRFFRLLHHNCVCFPSFCRAITSFIHLSLSPLPRCFHTRPSSLICSDHPSMVLCPTLWDVHMYADRRKKERREATKWGGKRRGEALPWHRSCGRSAREWTSSRASSRS